MEKFIFYILAAVIVISAIAAVSSQKLLRSVVYLLFSLVGIAGIYFMIDYNFLAAIQLTVYAGGIVVLIIFSVLLIHHVEMELQDVHRRRKIFTAFLCLLGLSVFLGTIYSHPFEAAGPSFTTTTAEIGAALLSTVKGGFILPFEVISILLLATMIGAIIIAKGGDEEEPEELDLPALDQILKEAEITTSVKIEIMEEVVVETEEK